MTNTTTQTPAEKLAAIEAKIQELPPFSRLVYRAINVGLYAEAGFSDVEATETAFLVGCKVEAIAAALGKLEGGGLVWVDDDAGRRTVGGGRLEGCFLHTFEHDLSDEVDGWHETAGSLFKACLEGHRAAGGKVIR